MPDNPFVELLKTYTKAYKHGDFSVLANYTVSKAEYSQLLTQIDKHQNNCLTPLERDYDAESFKTAFNQSHLQRIPTDTIIIENIQTYEPCQDVEVKKLSCYIYYNAKASSVSTQIILLKIAGNYKILTDVIDEKNLTK